MKPHRNFLRYCWAIVFLIVLLLGFVGNAVSGYQFNESNFSNLPIEASIELTVCLSGPPACDYDNIQAAIDAAPFDNEQVSWSHSTLENPFRVPRITIAPGIYSENITLQKNIWIQGFSIPGSVIIQQKLIDESGTNPTDRVLLAFGAEPKALFIENVTFAGGVEFLGSLSGIIKNVEVRPGFVNMKGNMDLSFENNILQGNLSITNSSPLYRRNIQISGNDIQSVTIKNAKNVDFSDNAINNSAAGIGISVDDSDGITISSNTISNHNVGMVLFDSEIEVLSNTIISNGFLGVSTNGGVYSQNTFEDNNVGMRWTTHDLLALDNNVFRNNRIGLSVAFSDDYSISLIQCNQNAFENEVNFSIPSGSGPIDEVESKCS